MQIISPEWLSAVSLAQVQALPVALRLRQFAQRDEVHALLWIMLVFFLAGQLLEIAANWVTSKALAHKKEASLKNATKLWLYSLISKCTVFFVVGLVLGVGMSMTSGKSAVGLIILSLLGGLLLIILILIILIAQVYDVSFLRALGFFLLSWVIAGALSGTTNFLAGMALQSDKRIAALATIGGKTDKEQQAFYKRLFGEDAPNEIDRMLDDALHPFGNPLPLDEREEMVRTIQQKLEARQKSIRPGDAAATTAFQAQLSRYKSFLASVTAERAKQPRAGP